MGVVATVVLTLSAALFLSCGDDSPAQTVELPPEGPELERTAAALADVDELLAGAAGDFAENNFGLAARKVVEAQAAASRAVRLELPLISVSRRIYTADVALRFGGDPAAACAELEAARDYLKGVVLVAGPDYKPLLGGFLERLIAVIDDADVSVDEKLTQLETLQRDLAEAVYAAEANPQP